MFRFFVCVGTGTVSGLLIGVLGFGVGVPLPLCIVGALVVGVFTQHFAKGLAR